ncbi:MAG: TRAP transporter small permease [Clostridiales bacterium]|nr:TRAP transporter small permease [Clostridiales bacterium]
MKKFFDGLKKAEEILMVILMIIMCVIIFVATVARFTNLFIISWAEELARYCMIWIIFLGVGVAAQNGEHFCVEALNLFLPKKVLNAISVLNAVLVMGFNFVAAYFGITIVQRQMAGGQITPSLNWPMWIIYLAIPVGLVLMAVSYAYHTYKKLTDKDEKDEEVLDV